MLYKVSMFFVRVIKQKQRPTADITVFKWRVSQHKKFFFSPSMVT